MKKALLFGFLMLLTGLILWAMINSELLTPADELAASVDHENFSWFTCSGCGKLFMAEVTTMKGNCPYCQFQLMLVTEDRRLMGRSTDENDFIWFFSPACGKVFFAYETKEAGACPYCNEAIELAAPRIADLEGPASNRLATWSKAHFGKLLFGVLGLFAASVTGIYLLLERRIILSFEPVDGAVSEMTNIELSRRQVRKKKLTMGDGTEDDIVLRNPSLKDFHYVLSFVRVGGKTHAYLHHGLNKPIWVNKKPEYNPRLKNHDKIELADIMFEVHTQE